MQGFNYVDTPTGRWISHVELIPFYFDVRVSEVKPQSSSVSAEVTVTLHPSICSALRSVVPESQLREFNRIALGTYHDTPTRTHIEREDVQLRGVSGADKRQARFDAAAERLRESVSEGSARLDEIVVSLVSDIDAPIARWFSDNNDGVLRSLYQAMCQQPEDWAQIAEEEARELEAFNIDELLATASALQREIDKLEERLDTVADDITAARCEGWLKMWRNDQWRWQGVRMPTQWRKLAKALCRERKAFRFIPKHRRTFFTS